MQNTKGVEIPQSTADVLPNQSVVVMITQDQLFVQGELVASIAEMRDPRTRADRAAARGARAADAREHRRRNRRKERWPSREITVLADKSLPYEVVKKVMATCTAATYGKISLAVIEKEKPAVARGQTST